VRYEESNMKYGLWEPGSSIMIMHLLTQHCQTILGKTLNSYPSTTPLFTLPLPS
jgi:hypothetical protein